jgi:hypothetical protein
MKRYALYYLYGVLLVCSTYSCAASSLVEIQGLRSGYSRGDIVRFDVLSRSTAPLHFYCTIEFQDKNGEWFELPYRMEDGRAVKGDRVYALAPRQSMALTWDPERVQAPSFPPNRPKLASGSYRIKLHFVVDERKLVEVSNPFSLNWNSTPQSK